jgi:hypothetical protein
MPIIPALMMLRQEDGDYKASLDTRNAQVSKENHWTHQGAGRSEGE